MGQPTRQPPALAYLLALSKQAVEGRDRGEVDALVQQRRPDLSRCLVAEPLGVEHLDDRLGLLRSDLPPRGRARQGRAEQGLAPCPVVAGPWAPHHLTGSSSPDERGELVHGPVQDLGNTSSEAALFEISSKSACTFPCTSMIASAWASLVRR